MEEDMRKLNIKEDMAEDTKQRRRLISCPTPRVESYNRRLHDIAILMFKHQNGLLPTYLEDIFISRAIKYNLRNVHSIPRFNTISYGKHLIRYFGPLLWSKLPKDVKDAGNLNTFKYKIKTRNLEGLVENSNCQNCHLCNS